MKRWFVLLIVFFITGAANAQKIIGQWRGSFNENGDIVASSSSNGDVEYVLELDVKGADITGYSYSYFQNRKYFVICSLKGTYNQSDETMLVTETARISGVTPPGWTDCLQTHFLKYQKTGNTEQLVGKWKAALGDCGSGSTTLERKTLTKIGGNTKAHTHITVSKPNVATDKTDNKTTETIVRRILPSSQPSIIDTSLAKKDSAPINDTPTVTVMNTIAQPIPLAGGNYEKRTNTLVQTIEIDNDSFQVDLYDSGDIDGDSVSLFYNGQLLLSHKRLDVTPISLTLDATSNNGLNELVMYAETLGTVPPNTGLMVVTDGKNRYEVYVTSDLKQSGTIRFIHKKHTE